MFAIWFRLQWFYKFYISYDCHYFAARIQEIPEMEF